MRLHFRVIPSLQPQGACSGIQQLVFNKPSYLKRNAGSCETNLATSWRTTGQGPHAPSSPARSGPVSINTLSSHLPEKSTIKRRWRNWRRSGELLDKDHMPPRHPLEESTIKRGLRNWRGSGEPPDSDHMPPRHPLGPALSHKHLELTSPRGVRPRLINTLSSHLPEESTIKRGWRNWRGSGEPPDSDHMPPRHPLEESTIKRGWRNWRRSGEPPDRIETKAHAGTSRSCTLIIIIVSRIILSLLAQRP
ncbi:hypothetical protein J6590_047958 [Homalodisca vitripennis]|nr:hypothetical protein J6590_047958 [Homalodisca vitripennis]